jgi:formylglycine-generating enzyme required for sulfatase activity
MAGNVWEWVADWYGFAYYANSQTSNPLGPSEGERRVLRGGAWLYADEDSVTTIFRNRQYGWQGDFYFGFRCAMDAE